MSDLLEDLIHGRMPAPTVSLVVRAVFLSVVVVGLIAMMTAPTLSTDELAFQTSMKAFVDRPDINAGQIHPYKLKVYLFSLPFRLAEPLGPTGQLFLTRALGLAFFLLGLWLAYQTARRVTLDNDLISLMVLGVLATNNRLFFSAVTLGGDVWLFFFFGLLIYEIVEFAAKGSIFDVFLGLILIFILSKFDIFLAEKVALPILFLAIVLTLLASKKDSIAQILPASTTARAAIAVAVIALYFLALRVSLLGMLLSAPAAPVISLARLAAWPPVIEQLVAFFSGSPSLAEGFEWTQRVLIVIFLITAVAAVAGLAWLAYIGARRIVVADDAKPARPEYNLPALAAVSLVPFTAFAAYTYQPANLLSDTALYALALPLALLVSIGLGRLASIGRAPALTSAALLTSLLTIDTASILLTILWR